MLRDGRFWVYVAGKTGLVKLSIISTNDITSLAYHKLTVIFVIFLIALQSYSATKLTGWLIYLLLSVTGTSWLVLYPVKLNTKVEALDLNISEKVSKDNVCVTDFQPIKDGCHISQTNFFLYFGFQRPSHSSDFRGNPLSSAFPTAYVTEVNDLLIDFS